MNKKRLTAKQKLIYPIIGSIVIAIITQLPTLYEMWEDRSRVDVSFGRIEGYPKEELQKDGNSYFIDIAIKNYGIEPGKVTIQATGVNAQLSFKKAGPYDYIQQQWYKGLDESFRIVNPPLYVIPDKDASRFSVKLSIVDPISGNDLIIPTELIYDRVRDKYILNDAK